MRRIIYILVVIGMSAMLVSAHTSLISKSSKTQDFKLEKVAGNVYALFGSGGNIGVSYGKDGLMTIDTQFAQNVPEIKKALATLGSDTPKFVFNTHHHGDHTGGNELFGVDAMIIAHYNVRERLLNRTDREGKAVPMPEAGLPMITYGKGLSIYMNGEQVKAVHLPHGHTDGDTAIFFTGSNVVHLGDDFFVGRFPFVDLNSGGSVPGLIKNIGSLIQMIPADAKLIPGHGPVSTISELRDYHNMLIETTLIVRGHMKDGKSLAEIKAAGLGEKFKEAGSGFINQERWIETIYNSYSIKMKK